jgi:uncharacterized protein YyaL (SSP411 family)
LAHTYANDRVKAIDYARQLHEGIQQAELIAAPQEISGFEAERLHELVVRWARSFDTFEGGTNKAPKFPLPNNWLFLLRYAQHFDEAKIEKQVRLTLDKIALGGIYDQVGGGFTRYSVDVLWKVPHFEKMLYDNGQLIGLYAKAYASYQTPHYKDVVFQTFDFLERELRSDLGAYYSQRNRPIVWGAGRARETLLPHQSNWALGRGQTHSVAQAYRQRFCQIRRSRISCMAHTKSADQ